MLGLLGLVGGFYSGAYLFGFIAALTGGPWDAEWVIWTLCCITAIAGLFIAFKHGILLVQISTAFVGSYLFMRSWSMIFPGGNYPSVADLIKSDNEPLEINFYRFLFCFAIFLVTFVFSLTYQIGKGKKYVYKKPSEGFFRVPRNS